MSWLLAVVLAACTVDETGGGVGDAGTGDTRPSDAPAGDPVPNDAPSGETRDVAADGDGAGVIDGGAIADFVVRAAVGLRTTEAGGQARFTVALGRAPTAAVRVALTSSDPSEGTVSPAQLTFTAVNWAAPQEVTVTGVDDPGRDRDVGYEIITAAALSEDASFAGLDPADVALVNVDDETPGFTIARQTPGFTSESGGSTTITVVLNTRPTANVAIPVASNRPTEASVAPATLVFTPDNWNVAQVVTATGVDDRNLDGPQMFLVVLGNTVSEDLDYDGLDPDDVAISNSDDESPGFAVELPAVAATSEIGLQASFTVALTGRPTGNVTVPLSSSDPSEGTVAPASLTFTPNNWGSPQTVVVTGVDDELADGNQAYNIVTGTVISDDPRFHGLELPDAPFVNYDNDSPGFSVAFGSIDTSETGVARRVTVALRSQPSANVVIAVASSDVSEGTVSPTALTFTPTNWNAPQTITVTGVDDILADGNQAYKIVLSIGSSDDSGYATLDPPDVDMTNTDNDSAGVDVVADTIETDETGSSRTFTVALRTQPIGNVVIPITSSDSSEGVVAPGSLTFTPDNWNAPQTVTVTGVDDGLADGKQSFRIVLNPATSIDAAYAFFDAPDLDAANVDNDSPGFNVIAGVLDTTESGSTRTFTIALLSQPTATVTVPLSSSDVTEGTIAPPSVTFTSVNWAAPQTVTVTGVDDAIADGLQPYRVVLGAAISDDPGYAGVNPADLDASNTDNDSPGFAVVAGTLATSETGVSRTFTVALQTIPTANVTIDITSSDATEGLINPARLIFTSANWNAPQTVTVTGVNDAVSDGNQPYRINLLPATSADPRYSGLDPADLDASNTDDDSPGVTVTGGPLATAETGTQSSFTVVLTTEPTADVTLSFTSSDATEGTVNPSTLTFTSANWNLPRTVTATGVDDLLADGSQSYTIVTGATVSADPKYSGLVVADVSASNTDNDSAGVTVAITGGATTTTEAGGTDTFTVVLHTQPTADVTIGVTSAATDEATALPATLTFTNATWNLPQTVTVTGVNDAIQDGSQPFTIVTTATSSADAAYNNLTVTDVSGNNTDDDNVGIVVSETGGGTNTNEAGGIDTFTVVLLSQPSGNVVVNVASSNTAEVTTNVPSLTFNAANWSLPQTVTLTGVNDALDDNPAPFTISVTVDAALTQDPLYDPLNPADITGFNFDDDSVGFLVTESGGSTTTGESLSTDSFTVVLTAQPTGNVVVNVTSGNTNEGTVSAPSLTFTSSNWSTPQTITVTGVNDLVDDGDAGYTIQLAVDAALTADPAYDVLDPSDVSATNNDNDNAGFTVTESGGSTTTAEPAGTDTFTVVLDTQPTGNVVVDVTSGDTTEGTVAPAQLTFTTANWNMAQTVTVTAANDFLVDGTVGYTVALAVNTAMTADATYDALNPDDVNATTTDNDIAGATVTPTAGLVTTEAGGTASFTVALNAQPTADVSISITSSNTAEGTVDKASLTFTSMNWSTTQTVTITGANETADDGDVAYTITTGAMVSTDASFSGVAVDDVSVSNTDDDTSVSQIRMFSGGTSNGNMGGRVGADTLCANAASGWAVGKTIHAFLSVAGADTIANMPTTYGFPSNVPIYGLSGAVKIGDNWADLLDGSIDASLSAAGATAQPYTYTGSTAAGALSGSTCSGFTLTTGFGTAGINNSTTSTWLVFGSSSCLSARGVVCIAY